jgi:peroxiredoxin (alkyl hydroperoxide reductase subunit C)
MHATTAPDVGQQAPEFRLRGPGGQPVTLSEYRGDKNVVLIFFPFAFSPVCSHQLPEANDVLGPRLEELDTVVFGISVDSHWANTAFARHLGLRFPLLSDFRREASAAYGMLVPGAGFSGRGTFVVDRHGRIAYRDLAEDLGDLDRVPEIQRVVSALEALPKR